MNDFAISTLQPYLLSWLKFPYNLSLSSSQWTHRLQPIRSTTQNEPIPTNSALPKLLQPQSAELSSPWRLLLPSTPTTTTAAGPAQLWPSVPAETAELHPHAVAKTSAARCLWADQRVEVDPRFACDKVVRWTAAGQGWRWEGGLKKEEREIRKRRRRTAGRRGLQEEEEVSGTAAGTAGSGGSKWAGFRWPVLIFITTKYKFKNKLGLCVRVGIYFYKYGVECVFLSSVIHELTNVDERTWTSKNSQIEAKRSNPLCLWVYGQTQNFYAIHTWWTYPYTNKQLIRTRLCSFIASKQLHNIRSAIISHLHKVDFLTTPLFP